MFHKPKKGLDEDYNLTPHPPEQWFLQTVQTPNQITDIEKCVYFSRLYTNPANKWWRPDRICWSLFKAIILLVLWYSWEFPQPSSSFSNSILIWAFLFRWDKAIIIEYTRVLQRTVAVAPVYFCLLAWLHLHKANMNYSICNIRLNRLNLDEPWWFKANLWIDASSMLCCLSDICQVE